MSMMEKLKRAWKIWRPFTIEDRGEAFDRAALSIGRVGFVARAIVWACIGGVAINSAINPEQNQAKDAPGALEIVAANTGGVVIMCIFIILLFTYGVWRLFEGFYGLKVHKEDARWKQIIEGYVVPLISGGVYFAFAGGCISAINDGVDKHGDDSSERKKKEWTVRVASLVIGQIFLTLIAIILFAVALTFLWIAIRRSYRRDLHIDRVNRRFWARWGVLISASLGLLGRAILFASLGILLIRVAWQREQFSAGMNDALNQWQLNSVGRVVIIIDGILLVFFGVFSLFQAAYKKFLRYREPGGDNRPDSFKPVQDSPSSSSRESESRRELESSPV